MSDLLCYCYSQGTLVRLLIYPHASCLASIDVLVVVWWRYWRVDWGRCINKLLKVLLVICFSDPLVVVSRQPFKSLAWVVGYPEPARSICSLLCHRNSLYCVGWLRSSSCLLGYHCTFLSMSLSLVVPYASFHICFLFAYSTWVVSFSCACVVHVFIFDCF